MRDGWSIVESPFRVEHAKAYEGLFTLGSGYLHVRGSLEEHLAGAPQNVSYTRMPANVTSETFPDTKVKWGTYVPGIFGRHPLLNNEMINLPWFLGMAPIIDGERLDMETCRILDYRRELCLDTATLTRMVRWQTRRGAELAVTFERFVSAARPHLCVQRMRLHAANAMGVTVEAGIDADVRTNGYDHFSGVDLAFAGPNGIGCRVRTDAGDDIEMATCLFPSEAPWRQEARSRAARLTASFSVPAGGELVIEKRTAVTTSRDRRPATASACLAGAHGLTCEQLHEEHAAVWRKRWDACDVIIEGDDESQLAMRASLFHLLRAHVPDDPRVAIDAKGYAGEAYWGRFFWDTEMFLLPFFVYTDPARARTLADFRVQSLDGAIANATRYGYRGARYAWESDAAGYECCPNWQYADHEVHVTADVAYGLVHYARAAGDAEYLRGPAARVLVETARYWQERIDARPPAECANLLGVMGPDEYKPISNNNAYTNRMVAFALNAAAEVGAAAGASVEECERWRGLAGGLPIVRADDGVLVLQCEGFDRLAEPRFDRLWRDRRRPFAAQVSQERLYRSKCLKQADVLMMMALFPDEFSDAEVRRAWEYYLPYTTHDSSLSAGVHAIVAARLGLADEAWEFWQRAKAIDLDIEHGGAAEGIHIANAGAVWQMAVFGFAGMRTAMQADVLTFAPRLPAAWSRLAFPIVWKGAAAYVDIGRDGVTVTNRGGRPLEVCVGREPRTIRPGERALWKVGA